MNYSFDIGSNNVRAGEWIEENPYLCECGTYLDLRTRVKQMQESGRLMYEAKKAYAQSQCLDSRLIDNDEDFEDSEFDEIDAYNASINLSEKMEEAQKRDLNANIEPLTDSDSKNINDVQKSSENASEGVSEGNS